MRKTIIKFSSILLMGLLVEWWLTQYSPLHLPVYIPHTPIRISGLLLTVLLIFVIIFFQKNLLKQYPEKTIFQLTMTGGLICLLSEIIFQLIRQPTLDSDAFVDRINNFTRGTLGMTIFGTIISFLVAFQIKTKKTEQLILIIIGIMVLSNLLLPLLGYKIN
jgi:hypothetical protein